VVSCVEVFGQLRGRFWQKHYEQKIKSGK